MSKYLSIAIALGMTATAGAAVSTYFEKVKEVNIAGTDYKVWDMKVDVDADWTNERMDLVLTAGQMYQDAFGTDREPPLYFCGAAFLCVTDVDWDTYLTVPRGYSAPVSFAGDPPYMDTTSITASWFDTLEDGPGTWRIARITLSDDAAGDITGETYTTEAPGVGAPFDEYYILNGEIIPEPITLSLLLAGGLLSLLRRRR